MDALKTIEGLPWEQLSYIATSIALIFTMIAFSFERRKQNRLLRIQYLIQAQDKYDSICALRSSNPDFVLIGKSWKLKDFSEMSEREISYYHYIELTLGFIETYVYLTYVAKVISRKMFFEFIEPMVWLEVSYNIPAFEHFAKARSISPRACAFLQFVVDRIKKEKQSSFGPGANTRATAELRNLYDFRNISRSARIRESSGVLLIRFRKLLINVVKKRK